MQIRFAGTKSVLPTAERIFYCRYCITWENKYLLIFDDPETYWLARSNSHTMKLSFRLLRLTSAKSYGNREKWALWALIIVYHLS